MPPPDCFRGPDNLSAPGGGTGDPAPQNALNMRADPGKGLAGIFGYRAAGDEINLPGFIRILTPLRGGMQTERLITLTPADWLIVALYFAAIIGIGFYLKRFADRKEDFFEAGRRNGVWVAGLAFVSANLGAIEMLGWSGGTVKYGMLVSHFYWIGAVPAMIFLGLYMMPFYYSTRIHSVPGYLLLRFDERTRLLSAFSFAIMTVLMSGVNLYLMALVFRTILGWNWDVSIWSSAAAVACYITLGGLLSAIFTEVIQFFLIWFGLFLVSILGIMDLGGLGRVFQGLPPEMSRLWADTGHASGNAMGVNWFGLAMGVGFVLSFGFWTTDFLLVQRAFTAKDLRTARLTPILASFFKMFLPFIVVVSGLVAYRLIARGDLPDSILKNPDSTLPYLIARYYPPGLIGLGITALLAGFMAGQAGNVSAFNTVWTFDIYQALRKTKATDAHLVKVGRITTLIGILISVAAAYAAKSFPTIMDFLQAIFSWVNAPLFATMLLGMFWKRTTSPAAFWGLLAGMITSFGIFLGFRLHLWGPGATYALTFSDRPSDMARNLWQAIWAWSMTLLVTLAITMATRPKEERLLIGLVRGLVPTERGAGANGDDAAIGTGKARGIAAVREPWLGRPGFWACMALALVVILNLIFW
ncbi:MAG: solute:Na+ symporter, family [Fibrobacteres bacterium]|nr:solute:Na+ symporter, family [Fibrobacterota bacterium]